MRIRLAAALFLAISAMPAAARSTSASSKTSTGAFPPSSRCTRLRSAAAAAATSFPARTLPVTDTILGTGWAGGLER